MFRKIPIILSQILIFTLWPLSFFLTNLPNHFDIFANSWRAGTVVQVSPLDYDYLVRKIGLFPNRNLARIEENKLTPIFSSFSLNFFSLIDPNNYFFGFHPREQVITNQNLVKFPPFSVIFFLVGIYHLKKLKRHKIYLIFISISVFLLSLLKVFDGFDLILFLPIFLIVNNGLTVISKKLSPLMVPLLYLFCAVSIVEFMRVILVH